MDISTSQSYLISSLLVRLISVPIAQYTISFELESNSKTTASSNLHLRIYFVSSFDLDKLLSTLSASHYTSSSASLLSMMYILTMMTNSLQLFFDSKSLVSTVACFSQKVTFARQLSKHTTISLFVSPSSRCLHSNYLVFLTKSQ